MVVIPSEAAEQRYIRGGAGVRSCKAFDYLREVPTYKGKNLRGLNPPSPPPPSSATLEFHAHEVVPWSHGIIQFSISISFLLSSIPLFSLPFSCPPSSFLSLYTDEEVTNGTIALSVKYGVVPYFSTSLDLCKTLQLQCPIKAGQGSLIIKENIPQFKHVSLVTLQIICSCKCVAATYPRVGKVYIC